MGKVAFLNLSMRMINMLYEMILIGTTIYFLIALLTMRTFFDSDKLNKINLMFSLGWPVLFVLVMIILINDEPGEDRA